MAPRRPIVEASASTDSSAETLDERYERLQVQIQSQRRLVEIEEMENELRTGVSPIRSVPAAPTHITPGARRAQAPPLFKGTSLKELRDFQQGCEVFFDAIDELDPRRRIATAASYLRDLPLQEWSRRTTTPTTWEAFTLFLRNTIADPANRMGNASLRLKRAEQYVGQSARQFASYIEELEEDIPEISYEEQRAWTLLNGLRAPIRSGVLRENQTILSRAQVLSAAQRQEELLAEGQITRKDTSAASEIGVKPVKRMRAATDVKSTACYNCGKEGHFKQNCPEPVKKA